jgi:RNA recognition motif-containing protein
MGGRKRARRRKRRQREFLINSSRQNQEEVERREKSKAEAARAAAEALQARLFVRKLNYSATANDIRSVSQSRYWGGGQRAQHVRLMQQG